MRPAVRPPKARIVYAWYLNADLYPYPGLRSRVHSAREPHCLAPRPDSTVRCVLPARRPDRRHSQEYRVALRSCRSEEGSGLRTAVRWSLIFAWASCRPDTCRSLTSRLGSRTGLRSYWQNYEENVKDPLSSWSTMILAASLRNGNRRKQVRRVSNYHFLIIISGSKGVIWFYNRDSLFINILSI